jgi:hypothetical protein
VNIEKRDFFTAKMAQELRGIRNHQQQQQLSKKVF